MNRYQGAHAMKWGAETRAYYGEAARFEPINLVFNSTLTANSSDSPDVVTTGNQWASFMLGALDNQTSARLVPLQIPYLRGYSAYFQDDMHLSDRLTVNLGLRWEFEPGPTDAENRLSQRLDLTQPIPEMRTTPPVMPSQALQLMASKNYRHTYNGAWIFASEDNRNAWHSSPWNFLPRAGLNYRMGDDSVARVGYARYLMPTSNVRDTLGDFVTQYSGFAQTTNTLGLADGVPQQTLANPFPRRQPGDRALRPGLRTLHQPGERGQPRPVRAAAADQRSIHLLVSEVDLGRHDHRRELLLQLRNARAV